MLSDQTWSELANRGLVDSRIRFRAGKPYALLISLNWPLGISVIATAWSFYSWRTGRVFRFSLRSLMIFTGVIGILCALARWGLVVLTGR